MWSEIKFFDGQLPSPTALQLPSPLFLPSFERGETGAWTEFTGTVRGLEKDVPIAALRYEIYRPMAKKVLEKHLGELEKIYGLLAVRFWHREGIVPVGEAAVYIALAAPHRKETLAALAELLDRLKTDVPIWKVESIAPGHLPEAEAELTNRLQIIRPGQKPPPLDSAPGVWKLLADRITPLGDERVPLTQARRRTLREGIQADTDQPAFDRSAMDGYALIPGPMPARYKVIGTVKAGEVAARAPGPGEALRIFTGAAVPAPGLAVLMQEDAKVDGEFIAVERAVAVGENVRGRGSDARAGDLLLSAETKLDATHLAMLAAVGAVHPLVNALPKVAHATTGDEIVPPEAIPGPGQIRNSNQILLHGLLQNSRVPLANIHQEHWGDDPAQAAVRLATEPFAQADIILISGGASVGEHDYTARVLEAAGFELVVRKVKLRPGRPLLVGFRGKQIAFGLPGNPVSHFVCYALFVHLALELLTKTTVWKVPRFHSLPLSQPLTHTANPRPTFWPGRFTRGVKQRSLEPLAWHNSGHLSALAGANAIIFIPPNTPELPAGHLVSTLAMPSFMLL